MPVELRVLGDPSLRRVREKRPERLSDPVRIEVSAAIVSHRKVKRAASLERDGNPDELGLERVQPRSLGIERDVAARLGERAGKRLELLEESLLERAKTQLVEHAHQLREIRGGSLELVPVEIERQVRPDGDE